jgi:hypothetical protein
MNVTWRIVPQTILNSLFCLAAHGSRISNSKNGPASNAAADILQKQRARPACPLVMPYS